MAEHAVRLALGETYMTGQELEDTIVMLSGRHRITGAGGPGATSWLQERLYPRVAKNTLARWMSRPDKPIPRWAAKQVAALVAAYFDPPLGR